MIQLQLGMRSTVCVTESLPSVTCRSFEKDEGPEQVTGETDDFCPSGWGGATVSGVCTSTSQRFCIVSSKWASNRLDQREVMRTLGPAESSQRPSRESWQLLNSQSRTFQVCPAAKILLQRSHRIIIGMGLHGVRCTLLCKMKSKRELGSKTPCHLLSQPLGGCHPWPAVSLFTYGEASGSGDDGH